MKTSVETKNQKFSINSFLDALARYPLVIFSISLGGLCSWAAGMGVAMLTRSVKVKLTKPELAVLFASTIALTAICVFRGSDYPFSIAAYINHSLSILLICF